MDPVPLQFFERRRFPLEGTVQKRRRKVQQKHDRKLLCRLCSEVITAESYRMNMNGAHVHSRQNPAGITYTFACFDAAPGCRAWGQASGEHTWFSGYVWQIAVCGGCGEHLGWLFKNGNRFYGLIVDRLIEDSNK